MGVEIRNFAVPERVEYGVEDEVVLLCDYDYSDQEREVITTDDSILINEWPSMMDDDTGTRDHVVLQSRSQTVSSVDSWQEASTNWPRSIWGSHRPGVHQCQRDRSGQDVQCPPARRPHTCLDGFLHLQGVHPLGRGLSAEAHGHSV